MHSSWALKSQKSDSFRACGECFLRKAVSVCTIYLKLLEDRVKHLLGLTLSPQVGREHLAFPDDLVDGPVDPVCTSGVALEAEHEGCRTDRRQRVRDALALDVGCGAVDAERERAVRTDGESDIGDQVTYGSPMTNLSPALTEGTRPSEPTRAAAASLYGVGRCQTIITDNTCS